MNNIDQYVNQLHEEIAERYYCPEEQAIAAHAELAYAVNVEDMPVEEATIIEEKVKEKIMNKKPVEKPINYSTPKEIAITETEKKKETKTVNKKTKKEVVTPAVIAPTTPKYLDNTKLISITLDHLRRHKITQLNITENELLHITYKLIPFARNKEVSEKDFYAWYITKANHIEISKAVGKVLLKNNIFKCGMVNGQLIALVNVQGFKTEEDTAKEAKAAQVKPAAKKGKGAKCTK